MEGWSVGVCRGCEWFSLTAIPSADACRGSFVDTFGCLGFTTLVRSGGRHWTRLLFLLPSLLPCVKMLAIDE